MTQGTPDFVVGLADESPGGVFRRVGHAVKPSEARDGEQASVAVCGTYTTVTDQSRPYDPHPPRARYNPCPSCNQRLTRMR